MAAFESSRSKSPLTPAAVAIVVLVDSRGEPCVPIFQRTSDMRRHASQMALPGGKLHAGEDATGAALRELEEELGLRLDADSVLGRLDDFDTKSGFTITPVVVWGGSDLRDLLPSKAEVARLFPVPLAVLRQASSAAHPGASELFSLLLPGVQVFAPTAAILYQFSEVALEGRAVRVADFYQPPWTHR
ncbi:MAG TPA: CoA pyrophosphatase [Patescibacteria group bacterium]|nr:CoA pyrophosphatase [Patescibacteria group bacterium]